MIKNDPQWAVDRLRHYARVRNRQILLRAGAVTLVLIGAMIGLLVKGGIWLLS